MLIRQHSMFDAKHHRSSRAQDFLMLGRAVADVADGASSLPTQRR